VKCSNGYCNFVLSELLLFKDSIIDTVIVLLLSVINVKKTFVL